MTQTLTPTSSRLAELADVVWVVEWAAVIPTTYVAIVGLSSCNNPSNIKQQSSGGGGMGGGMGGGDSYDVSPCPSYSI